MLEPRVSGLTRQVSKAGGLAPGKLSQTHIPRRLWTRGCFYKGGGLPHARLGSRRQRKADPPGASSTLSALAHHSPAVNSGSGPRLKLPMRKGHGRQAGGRRGLAWAQGHLPGCLSIAGLAPRPTPCFSLWFGQGPRGQWERPISLNGT